MRRQSILFLTLCLAWQVARADEDADELAYYQQFPVVLSATRLSQPLSESPNAMTVIDRGMIVASGSRNVTDLLKLVPGMYVSYYKGSQPIVAYHGATDSFSRRMQVMIDGRSVYLPPDNTVDWASLPITVDDIERIEVIRGPAAASYGANSTQGVINIITRDAASMNGTAVSYRHGDKGINDVSARFGSRGRVYDYRMTLAYTADNGYDALSAPPNGIPITQFKATSLLNNSNDSNQARLLNYRGNYHPDDVDNVDVQLGFNRDIQGVGFSDKNPTPAAPLSTNGDPYHDLLARSGFAQLGWSHMLENSSKLDLRYSHTQESQYEALPVYLNGVYYPGPVIQSLDMSRDQVQLQHTLPTSTANRILYGVVVQRDHVEGYSNMPPLALTYHSSFAMDDYQAFANDEWRINRQFLLNTGAMYERDYLGFQNLSPRAAVDYHLTQNQTLRAGVSVAYRTPSLSEVYYPTTQPGALIVPGATVTSPNLTPEKIVSRDLGYLGEFPDYEASMDLRLYSDLLSNVIVYNKSAGALQNLLCAELHGFEATVKKSLWESANLTFNFSHQLAGSNAVALVGAGYSGLKSNSTLSNDLWAASVPRNSASLLYAQHLGGGMSFSTAYYYQSAMQPFDRGAIDFQPVRHRLDMRIAQGFRFTRDISGEVALVAQNLFSQDYTEYLASNVFNRRGYIQVTANW